MEKNDKERIIATLQEWNIDVKRPIRTFVIDNCMDWIDIDLKEQMK